MSESNKNPSDRIASTILAGTPVVYVLTWEEERLERIVSMLRLKPRSMPHNLKATPRHSKTHNPKLLCPKNSPLPARSVPYVRELAARIHHLVLPRRADLSMGSSIAHNEP